MFDDFSLEENIDHRFDSPDFDDFYDEDEADIDEIIDYFDEEEDNLLVDEEEDLMLNPMIHSRIRLILGF